MNSTQHAETQVGRQIPVQLGTPPSEADTGAEGHRSVRQTPANSPQSLCSPRSGVFSTGATPTKATVQEPRGAPPSKQPTAHVQPPARQAQPDAEVANLDAGVDPDDVQAFLNMSVCADHVDNSPSFDDGILPFNALSLDQAGGSSSAYQGYSMPAPEIRDDFLYPWPGSLAAAYQAVSSV